MAEKGNRQIPALFGQKHSSRDYSKPSNWGKNMFNSSFPASLVAYMHSKGIDPIYLCTNAKNEIQHKTISAEKLFGVNPLGEEAYYNYEAGFTPFEQFYTGDREKIDLVMFNRLTNLPTTGLEIKLTALPDNTTKDLKENEYSCEIVVRPPTICFLACSICQNYNTDSKRNKLKKILSIVPQINHWEEISEVAPHYKKIEEAIMAVSKDMCKSQSPLMIQPIWKTEGGKMRLAEDCLDVFVWSNLATIQLFCAEERIANNGISRFQRAVIWLYRMLFDYTVYSQFDYVRIIKLHSYNYANDKAFAVGGKGTYKFLTCDELTHPRIQKGEIKNIILGGGQNLLSPERRFDAVLVNSPDIFD